MFATWKTDKFPAIRNKNYSIIFSGSGFIAKESVSPLIFQRIFELDVRVKFSSPCRKILPSL